MAESPLMQLYDIPDSATHVAQDSDGTWWYYQSLGPLRFEQGNGKWYPTKGDVCGTCCRLSPVSLAVAADTCIDLNALRDKVRYDF